jgi:hypothetical protein
MKAIKYFGLYIFSVSLLFSCKPKEQAKHSLNGSTKEYFEVKDQSQYVFADYSDTTITVSYTTKNYFNSQANPDIENSEILFYDLDAGAGKTYFTVRCESGGSEFRDRIALVANNNGNISIAAILFNQGGNFTTSNGSGDSVLLYPTYTIKNRTYSDVIRVKLNPSNPDYRETLFAKHIGLIGYMEKKDNKYFFLKSYQINK